MVLYIYIPGTPKRLYFFGHFAYDHIFWSYGIYAKIPNSKLHACGGNHDTSIFQYVSNMFPIICQYFSFFQYCPILQFLNMFSICFQNLSIFFKHATCRQIPPNMGIWPRNLVISPNSANKWSYGVPGIYIYISFFFRTYMICTPLFSLSHLYPLPSEINLFMNIPFIFQSCPQLPSGNST